MDRYRGFAQIERDYIRGSFRPDFEWAVFDAPSPRNPPRVPLAAARVALISTAGAHLPDQPRHAGGDDGDHTYRAIPADAEEVQLHHGGYDVRRARTDPDVVFPLGLLHELAADGVIGAVGPVAYGFMGSSPDTGPLMDETGPEVARALIGDAVDLALLVPA
ncbi:MAG: glycine/sarcosine/betaine reductase selenoprotein B family protein [Actinomycetota bacterium]